MQLPAEPLPLVTLAALDGQSRVARESGRLRLRAQAEGEHRTARVANEPLVAAGVAEVQLEHLLRARAGYKAHPLPVRGDE
jgi:hypothetical protein